ncbi:hypothetical protein DY000_02016396 [Brassica cretica]|uniref:Uncharacterized protein n=1 Tax=Brassica cretica TaxID=69181 RepID=A0ABQ7DBL1_BRACR|nr:hypothetical protein DY000_02016396 [Brassica cretica]
MSPILDRIVRTDCGARQCTDQITQLGTVGNQLTSAWRSVPVRTSVAGSERLPSHPDGPCGTKSLGAILAEQGNETKAWGSWFPCGNCQGSSWGGYGSGYERFWAKRMDTRQKEKEKDLAPGERTPKVSGVVRKPSDIAGVWSDGSDLMALNQGLGRFRNDVHGLGWIFGALSKLARLGPDEPFVQTWTVVKEMDCEESSSGKMCGDWVFVDRCEALVTYCACCEFMIAYRGLVGLRNPGSGLTNWYQSMLDTNRELNTNGTRADSYRIELLLSGRRRPLLLIGNALIVGRELSDAVANGEEITCWNCSRVANV